MTKRTYTFEEVKRGELTGFFTFAAAILFAFLVTWVAGCGGSNIPIGDEPTCADLVTDECVPEVVEEFCEELPPICYTRDEAREHDRRLCLTCMNNVVCDEPEPVHCEIVVVVGEWSCDDFEDGRPEGHKPFECRR